MSRKHCGKRRNCSLRATSPFPTAFSKRLLQTRENQGLFWKGLNVSRCWCIPLLWATVGFNDIDEGELGSETKQEPATSQRKRERERERLTYRQTDRGTVIPTNKQTDREHHLLTRALP